MSTAESPGSRFNDCLGRMRALLERGDAIAASALGEELDAIIAQGPAPMTEAELADAQNRLGQCRELERALRQSTLSDLQRLGALRRARVYRRP